MSTYNKSGRIGPMLRAAHKRREEARQKKAKKETGSAERGDRSFRALGPIGHTQGPWQVHQGTANSAYFIVGDNGKIVVASMPCETVNSLDDARLIASAPDLLNTLKLWLDLMAEKSSGQEFNDMLVNTERITLAAIARAEGK